MYKGNPVSMIVARDLENTIGIDNDLPWRCKGDLKHFRETTTGKVCIMGRKTFESLPAPLKKRKVIVVSRDSTLDIVGRISRLDDHYLASTVTAALNMAIAMSRGNEIMICGGSAIYKEFLPYVDKAYVSVINTIVKPVEGKTLVKLDLTLPKEIDVKYRYFNLE